MFQTLMSKYDLRLPRYTSYPTTPHFSPVVEAVAYAGWLSALSAANRLSLYVHIVYCAEMCWFCGCHTRITRKYHSIVDYIDAMFSEIDLVAEQLPGKRVVYHIHFGGGSPTILSPEDFTHTIARLRSRFAIAPDAEIAVELDPRTTDAAYVAAMAAAGVTRASIGVQDFNETVQKAINRIQPHAVTAQVIDWLRAHGITAINMDLVYGLPHQTTASVVETIDQAVALGPQRLSLFGYAHVPWMKKHQRLIDETVLPDTAERWCQYEAAHARLASHGYVAVGLDHYAAPDDELVLALREERLHRNFQGYTTDQATVLLGFGASAISSLPQGYVINEGDVAAYKRLIRSGRLATRRGIALTEDDHLRRAVIERLMCDMAVDLDAVAACFGRNGALFMPELDALAGLEADGVVVRTDRTICVTPAGRPLVRAVCAVFDRYLKTGEHRHSKAV